MTSLRLVAASLVVGLLVASVSLLRGGGDPTALVKFGAERTAVTSLAEAEIGREVTTLSDLGHDGQFFFVQALDPLHLDPEGHADRLDRPVYRSQRMLYPLLAGGGGLVPAAWLPVTMLLVNLGALVLGTLGTAALARRGGASGWWGLAFTLNIGMIFETDISGAGVVAFAAAIWGVVMVEDDRLGAAAAWFTIAVLAREVMFVFLAGVVVLWWLRTRRIPWVLGFVPAAAAGGWALYLRARLGEGTGLEQVEEFGAPLRGLLLGFENWLDRPVDLMVIGAVLVIVPFFVAHAIRRPSYLSWGALGFVVLAILLSRQVWWRFFDITRAVAPVITAYVILALATTWPRKDDAVSAPRRRPVDAASIG